MSEQETAVQNEFERFVGEAKRHLQQQQRRIGHIVRNHDGWSVDSNNGILTLRTRGFPLLSTRVVLVGRYSADRSQWSWGWSERDVPEVLVAALDDLRAVGEARGFHRLTRAHFSASADDAWDMVSTAALVLDGRGAHSVTQGATSTFYVLLDPLAFESLAPPAACEW